MKFSHLLTKLVFLLSSMCCCGSFVLAQYSVDTIEDIRQHIASQKNTDEALVQRYYGIQDLRQAIVVQSPQSPSIKKLDLWASVLRKEIDYKKSHRPLDVASWIRVDQYRSGVLSKDKLLDQPCLQFSTLVDDRSFALDLPSAFVMATWLMESGCGWSRPANGDGAFQIVSKDYGSGSMTTGHWIWMMVDFNDFVRAKFVWYNKANNIKGPLPINYQHIDYTGLVTLGALYNGLSGSIKGTIMPASKNYVFGKLNDQYSGAVKDGLLVRVMKVMKYYSR